MSDIPQLTAEDVKRSIDNKEDIVLLDVRTLEEFARGKIEGSINIPVDHVSNDITSGISDKNKYIYVYCLSGARSDIVVGLLKQLGYIHVFSMTSGLLMWRSKGYFLSV